MENQPFSNLKHSGIMAQKHRKLPNFSNVIQKEFHVLFIKYTLKIEDQFTQNTNRSSQKKKFFYFHQNKNLFFNKKK